MVQAARDGGVVTTSDLRTCGFSEPAIQSALRRGLLTRWGRGVYLVGPVTDELTEARAAARAMPHGALGFAVAAQLAKIGPVAAPPLSVIVPPGRRAGRKGVRIHRIALDRRDVTRLEGLPATVPAVTIVHLARVLPQLPFEQIVQEAFAKRLTSAKQLRQRSTATAAAAAPRGCAGCSSSASTTCAPEPSAHCATGYTRPACPFPSSMPKLARGS